MNAIAVEVGSEWNSAEIRFLVGLSLKIKERPLEVKHA